MPRIILLTDFTEQYAISLMKGVVQYSKESEPWVLCKMPLAYRDLNGVEGVLEWALKWKADGIIAQFNDDDDVAIFKQHRIVAMAQDFKHRFTDIPNITGEHRLAGRMGAAYFLKRGFVNFAFYGYRGVVWSEERCEGFRQEIGSQGFGANFYEYQNEESTELWFYETAPLVEWLKSLPKPVALMACDDNQGHHIIEVCGQCGIKVPEEVAVLGVDNDDIICTMSEPSLSSLQQDVEKGGYEAAKLMDALIKNPGVKFKDIVVRPTNIITRQSTDIYATDDKYISRVLKHIHQHSEQRLAVADLVRLVPLSRRLLESRFREVTGSSIYAYMLNLRLEKFADKLIENDEPITEIAFKMGFTDYKNISRQFKNRMGCTPTEYRRR